MINFAHRGASLDYPENTILAFKQAIQHGATGLELDVHKTKDGKLVVIHDEDVQRTFLSKGEVKDLNWDELKQLKNCRLPFRDLIECQIPLLEDVLKLVEEHQVMLNIELKTDIYAYEGIEQDVIELIKQYDLKNRIIISSFNAQSLKICKNIDPTIKRGFLYYKEISDVIEYAKALEVDAIHPHVSLVSEELIKQAHKNHLFVNVYTVNSSYEMRKLIKAGVDGIFTDCPQLLNEIIKEESF